MVGISENVPMGGTGGSAEETRETAAEGRSVSRRAAKAVERYPGAPEVGCDK